MGAGLDLARAWYEGTVAGVLTEIRHAAALIGDGSEVLGYDDAVSRDHDFGARVQVFVDPAACSATEDAVRCLQSSAAWVEVLDLGSFFSGALGFDPVDGVEPRQWLALPTQRLASLTAGAVFHDPDEELTRRRKALGWYPDDVWRFVLAASWARVGQQQPFVGRTGGRGDDLGSRLVTARIVEDLVRLAFLTRRRWAPYPKWLGTAFAGLLPAGRLGPLLERALAEPDWRERERALYGAAGVLIEATNATRLADPVDPFPVPFHTRDLRVVQAEVVVTHLLAGIRDPEVRAWAEGLARRDARDGPVSLPGAIDQLTDNVDVLTHPARCAAAVTWVSD